MYMHLHAVHRVRYNSTDKDLSDLTWSLEKLQSSLHQIMELVCIPKMRALATVKSF